MDVESYALAKRKILQVQKKYDANLDGVLNITTLPVLSDHNTGICVWIYRYDSEFGIDSPSPGHRFVCPAISLTDASVKAVAVGDGLRIPVRIDLANSNGYTFEIKTGASTADAKIVRWDSGSGTTIATESVDLNDVIYTVAANASGSTLAYYRDDLTATKISATDTNYTSGLFGTGQTNETNRFPSTAIIAPPMSRLPPALRLIEFEVIGSGSPESPGTPNLKQNLTEIGKLTNVPDFLKREAKKYEILKSKGFTDEEIEVVLGYTPQRYVDLCSITWGVFDYKNEPTMLCVITGDNPYKQGAVLEQEEHAKSKNLKVFKPPRNLTEAEQLHRQIKQDRPDIIAGKHNLAYQCIGDENLEPLAVADFYDGFVQGTYDMKDIDKLPEGELEGTVNMWIKRLEKANVPSEEKDKHMKKLKGVLKS